MKEELEQIKRELRSHNYRKDNLVTLTRELWAIEKQLEGVNGISYDRIPVNSQTMGGKPDSWYSLLDQEERLLKRIDTLKAEIEYVDDLLDTLEPAEKEIVVAVYVDKVGVRTLAKRLHYNADYLYEKAQNILLFLLAR